jgi:hypothetical protein
MVLVILRLHHLIILHLDLPHHSLVVLADLAAGMDHLLDRRHISLVEHPVDSQLHLDLVVLLHSRELLVSLASSAHLNSQVRIPPVTINQVMVEDSNNHRMVAQAGRNWGG